MAPPKRFFQLTIVKGIRFHAVIGKSTLNDVEQTIGPNDPAGKFGPVLMKGRIFYFHRPAEEIGNGTTPFKGLVANYISIINNDGTAGEIGDGTTPFKCTVTGNITIFNDEGPAGLVGNGTAFTGLVKLNINAMKLNPTATV